MSIDGTRIKAEDIDSTPLNDGLTLPDEIKRREDRKNGKSPKRRDPKPPKQAYPDGSQFNFTYDESCIMKAGNNKHFEQANNAQTAVDSEGSMLILGHDVTNHAKEKRERSTVQ